MLLKAKNGNIYEYHDRTDTEVSLTNLTTGAEGKIPNERMKSLFTIPLRLNQMSEENPNLKELIKLLNLSYDNEL